MRKPRSAFLAWFIEQHGPREPIDAFTRSDAELSEVIKAGKRAAEQLESRKLWDEKHQSALYAWQARDKA